MHYDGDPEVIPEERSLGSLNLAYSIRSAFGFIAEIPELGHNSSQEFIADKPWACLIEFPSSMGARASLIGMAIGEILGRGLQSDAHVPNAPMSTWRGESERFAYVNFQDNSEEIDWRSLGSDVSKINSDEYGESIRISLYKAGQLIAATDDSIFLNDIEKKTDTVLRDWLLMNGVEISLKCDEPIRAKQSILSEKSDQPILG